MRGFFLAIFPFPVVIQVKYSITIQDKCVIGQRDGLQISFTILLPLVWFSLQQSFWPILKDRIFIGLGFNKYFYKMIKFLIFKI